MTRDPLAPVIGQGQAYRIHLGHAVTRDELISRGIKFHPPLDTWSPGSAICQEQVAMLTREAFYDWVASHAVLTDEELRDLRDASGLREHMVDRERLGLDVQDFECPGAIIKGGGPCFRCVGLRSCRETS